MRRDVFGLEDERLVVTGARIGGKRAPTGHRGVEVAGDELAVMQIGVGRFVGSDHAGPRAGLDRHVADGHPLFHAESLDGAAGVFDGIAGAAGGGEATDEIENQILGGHAGEQPAVDAQLHGLGLVLQQRLRGQHVFHFAGADAEGQGPERSVRGGVTVAADDGHARLSQTQLGADDVHNPLLMIVEIVHANAELPAIRAQGVDLLFGNRIGDRQAAIGRRHVVVGRGNGQLGPTNPAASQPQSFEGLGAGHFVDQMQVDVQDRLLAGFGLDNVGVPDFFEHRPRRRAVDIMRGQRGEKGIEKNS